MKNANYVVLVLAITTVFFSCKPEGGEITQTGIVFYPSSTWGTKKQYIFGSSQEGNLLSSLYAINKSDTTLVNRQFEGRIEFDLYRNTINEFPIYYPDSIEVKVFKWTNSNKYIAFGTELRNPQKPLSYFMYLDKNFEVLSKQLYSDVEIRGIWGFTELSNGNFVLLYHDSESYKLLCFDRSFKTVWLKKFNQQTIALFAGTTSILLYQGGKFNQYDYAGKFLRSHDGGKDLLNNTFDIENIIGLPDGFLFYGKLQRGDKYDLLIFNKFDKDMKLVKSKLIETKEISADPNFVFDFSSNILVSDNTYYFVGKISDPLIDITKPNKTAQAKLIKLDGQLDLVFSKSIVDKHLLADNIFLRGSSTSFLMRHNDQILTISNASWREQIGISFIKTDLDGNIIN